MKFDRDIYRFADFMLRCEICSQHYPLWMTHDEDWKAGLKPIRKIFSRLVVKDNGRICICKPCWEHFNGPACYLSLETYVHKYFECGKECNEETIKRYEDHIAALKEIWNAAPEYSEEKHAKVLQEGIDHWEPHWNRKAIAAL